MIQISTNGGFGARWNPQGREVFYRSPAGKLMAVSLKMDGNSAVVSTPRELFTLPVSTLARFGSQYDVGQDRRFAAAPPTGASTRFRAVNVGNEDNEGSPVRKDGLVASGPRATQHRHLRGVGV